MSAFASKGFNASAYLALRPVYNHSLLEWLLSYHSGKRTHAADVACGPGTFTIDLAHEFDHVTGVDPSLSMIESARSNAYETQISNIEYKQGSGECLPIASGTVDLMAVMQGAHWFKFDDFLSEVQRVLRPGGTLALVGYCCPEIASWPESMKGRDFARVLAMDQHLLGRYWDSGVTLIDELYAPLMDKISANTGFVAAEHLKFPKDIQPESSSRVETLPGSWIDSKSMTLDGFRDHLKTWSAYKAWKDKHPSDADIVDKYFGQQLCVLGKTGSEVVEIEWPHFAIVARKAL
ncbi:trans-aconitate methyltransferase 1 [Coemansia sp. RSA 2320]|nr:trans-aconitate methyltransferase 1 [Coemansia sp. RSA 2320]